MSDISRSYPVKTGYIANHLLEFFEIQRDIDIQDIYPKLIKSYKYYNHFGLNGLDYPDSVPHRKSEGLRVYDDSRVFILKNHLNGICGMIGYLYIMALIAQYTVEAFYENWVMRA